METLTQLGQVGKNIIEKHRQKSAAKRENLKRLIWGIIALVVLVVALAFAIFYMANSLGSPDHIFHN